MKYKSINSRFIVVFSIILAAALLRLLPHWPNFTPIAAMLLSDLVIGLHSIMPAVYISFAITVLIGMHLRNKVGVGMVVFASLSSSVIFFLITNFAAWQASPIYPQTMAGLIECYIAGLAFFRDTTNGISFFINDLIGTTFYSAIFYGSFFLLQLRFPVLDRSRF